jgi:ABC-type transporter Mla subunit MlaD
VTEASQRLSESLKAKDADASAQSARLNETTRNLAAVTKELSGTKSQLEKTNAKVCFFDECCVVCTCFVLTDF